MSYGTECQPIKVNNIEKIQSTQMKMPQMLCEKTLKDRVKSELILRIISVEPFKRFF